MSEVETYVDIAVMYAIVVSLSVFALMVILPRLVPN